ncbi:transcriptional repressor TCF25-domain-containing protein [Xylariales sp. PMI_506]|nr:transcriptional repressor TCF25-domain-containing protein [Xylariales sp. PMI_506]
MSTRQLRKLQKQRELEALEARNDASEESEEDVPVRKPKASLFSGFAALGDQDEDEQDEDDNETAEPTPPERDDAPEPVASPKTSSKKAKKKKKKAKKAAAVEVSEKNEEEAPKSSAGGVDEIDLAIQELNLKAQSGNTSSSADGQTANAATRAYERICELLRINTQHLKVMNEMRNLFGRDAIAAAQSEEREDEQGRARRRAGQLQQNVDLETFLKGRPGKSLPEVTLRRNPFLTGKDTWPVAATEGLTMKPIKDGTGTVSTECGTVEFGFAHDENYNTLEKQFFQLVQMYDPMQLVYFLQRHPYHVSTLIQVSKVAKQDQNSALAGDLCERALFTFGRVSLSAFRQKLEQGKARLEFRRPENRQFWLAGYHYLKSLTMKGTYRTALEWTKLIFSMDLSDPYGVVHFMHPLAIRAHESKWFIDFCDSEALDRCDTAQDYIRQTLVLARLQQKDAAGAKALLIEGMERLPWLYSAIFKALGLDVPRAIWGIEPRDEHELLFTELYVYQTKQLWDNAQAMGLLKEAASLAQKPNLDALPPPPVAGRNVGRFVYLDNTPALMGLVPGGMLHGFPNWDFDPLPPPKEDNVFSYESQQMPWNPDRSTGSDASRMAGIGGLAGRGVLQRMLQRAMRQGAPAEIREELEAALAQMRQNQGDDDNNDEDEDDDDNGLHGFDDDDDDEDGDREASPQQDGQQGLWQAFMDMIWPVRVMSGDEAGEGEYGSYDDIAPGAWPSDEDDDDDGDRDMPVLIREELGDDDSDTDTRHRARRY